MAKEERHPVPQRDQLLVMKQDLFGAELSVMKIIGQGGHQARLESLLTVQELPQQLLLFGRSLSPVELGKLCKMFGNQQRRVTSQTQYLLNARAPQVQMHGPRHFQKAVR